MLVSWGFGAFHIFGSFTRGPARKKFVLSWLAFMGFAGVLMAAVEIGKRWGGMTDPMYLHF